MSVIVSLHIDLMNKKKRSLMSIMLKLDSLKF